ncbi:MAG: hypothetical protein ACK4IX_15670, partial [Candidatus Sericytochromatia bacterium]
MLKKISIFTLFLVCSCQNNLDNQNITTKNSNIISSTNDNKNTELTNIKDERLILDSNSFKYKDNLNNLKKILQEDLKIKIRQVYIDNNNNIMIFLSNKLYVLNKELEIIKTSDLDTYSQFGKPILDYKGNGFI